MSASLTVKTFFINRRGRRYFACTLARHAAKLVINPVSDVLEVGRTATLEVKDISFRTSYGTELRFEPVRVLDYGEAARIAGAARRRAEIDRHLDYAKSDAANGLCRTKAILAALEADGHFPELAEQIGSLKAQVEANRRAEQERQRQWAAERAEQARQRVERRAELTTRRILYPVSGIPALNVPRRVEGGTVVFTGTGKRFRIDENHPSMGNPHLLGHEGSLGCYCYFRDATEEEVRELEAREAEEVAKAAVRERVAEIGALVRQEGECPEGPLTVQGECLFDTFDIHGGGSRFVIDGAHIWFIENNGMDGDDWSRNNVRTGGAGAVGHRIAFDRVLADEFRGLAATLGSVAAKAA